MSSSLTRRSVRLTGPSGCACQRSQDGFAYCLMPSRIDSHEVPCCTSLPSVPYERRKTAELIIATSPSAGVEGSYCVRSNNRWPICPQEGVPDTARIIDTPRQGGGGGARPPPSRPSPLQLEQVRRPLGFGQDAKSGNKDDDIYDMSNDLVPTRARPYSASPWQPLPARPSATSKLSELRLSPDWDVYAPPQKREYFWEIAEHPGSPDGCAFALFVCLRYARHLVLIPSLPIADHRPMFVSTPHILSTQEESCASSSR